MKQKTLMVVIVAILLIATAVGTHAYTVHHLQFYVNDDGLTNIVSFGHIYTYDLRHVENMSW